MSLVGYRLGDNDRLTVGGVALRPVGRTPAGHVLCRADEPGMRGVVTDAQLARLQKREDFRYSPGYFSPAEIEAQGVDEAPEPNSTPRRSYVTDVRHFGLAYAIAPWRAIPSGSAD